MKFINNLLNRKPTIKVAQAETQKEVQTPEVTIVGDVKPGDWFTSKEHYLEFRAAFKKYANEHKHGLTPAHFILYAILRNRDWKDGWTIPTHPGKKVENQAKLSGAWNMIKAPWCEEHLLKPFDGTITTEMLMVLRENLNDYRGS